MAVLEACGSACAGSEGAAALAGPCCLQVPHAGGGAAEPARGQGGQGWPARMRGAYIKGRMCCKSACRQGCSQHALVQGRLKWQAGGENSKLRGAREITKR
eukprot:165648-Pelagomonas_calceolata.AAC.8